MSDFVQIGDVCICKEGIHFFRKTVHDKKYLIELFCVGEDPSPYVINFNDESTRNTAFDDAVSRLVA